MRRGVEIDRKGIHLLATVFALITFYLPEPYASAVLVVLAVSVVAGSWVGSQILERVNERVFTWLYRTVLTLVAVRLVLVDGLELAGLL